MNESDGEGERLAPLVAIINSSEGSASLLRQILEDAGLRTAVAYVPDLRRGQPDPTELLTERDPRVIVYDVAVPYEESWDFLLSLRRLDAARGRRFVLTTTNKRVLESMVGPTGPQAVVEEPFNVEQILGAVRRALGETRRMTS